MISVIIPIYNRAKILKKSLDSLMGQTCKDFEVILVDDGSKENIESVFDNFKNKLNIKYFRKDNEGAPSARNFGFEKSRGDYIIFFDADIIAETEMFGKMRWVLDAEKNIDFIYSNYFFGDKKMFAKKIDIKELEKNNFIHTSSLIRREKVISWDENLNKFQDWDYFLRLVKNNSKGFLINEFLYKIISGGTMSEWLPSFAYKKPFKYLPFFYKKVKKYNLAKEKIKLKHNLK